MESVKLPTSSEAVKSRTGRDWKEWIRILDQEHGDTLGHKAIAELLYEKYSVPGWWAQMVTVGYEQVRGLRVKHQRPDGFEISVTRMIGASASRVFSAWRDPKQRSRWLPDVALTIHKSTPHKSMRITWSDGTKCISVGFLTKGPGKTQVALQHGRLASAALAHKMKAFWGVRLDALKTMLEDG